MSAYLAGYKSESHPKEPVRHDDGKSEQGGGDETPAYGGTRFNPCPFDGLTCPYTTWSGSFATYLCREKMPSRPTDAVRFSLVRQVKTVPSAAGPRALRLSLETTSARNVCGVAIVYRAGIGPGEDGRGQGGRSCGGRVANNSLFCKSGLFRSTKCGVRIRHVGGCRIRDALSFVVMDPAGFDDRDIRQESLYRYLGAFILLPSEEGTAPGRQEHPDAAEASTGPSINRCDSPSLTPKPRVRAHRPMAQLKPGPT